MLVDLLPRGVAWASARRDGSVMARFFRALARPLAAVEARVCDLWFEFFCHSASETRDWWLIDHGLPDACDPWPDPCVKRRSIGATRCADWAAAAEAAGWSLACELRDACGGRAGEARVGFRAGTPWLGPILVLTVDLAASPAMTAPRRRPMRAGGYRAGQAVGCGPDISALQCLLERLIPDHLGREWRVIHG